MLLLEVLTVTLVAVVMGLALAHALEFPGKMRLGKEEYLGSVQEQLGVFPYDACRYFRHRAHLTDDGSGNLWT